MDATIAAISTAMSASGIGIVRISGAEAMDVIAKIYRSKNGKKNICEVDSHTIHYGFIYDGEEVVDEVLVMIMRGASHLHRRGHRRNRLSWWRVCHETCFGDRAQKRSRNRRTGRIYQESIPEWKTGPLTGGGCYGCYPGEELHGTQKFSRTA